MRLCTVFENVDALPGAERQFPLDQGNGQLRLREQRADMRRHIVRTFGTVAVPGRVLRNQSREKFFDIAHDVGIGIFLNGQRRGSVLDENGQDTSRESAISDPTFDLAVHRIKTLAARSHLNSVGELFHSTVTLLARLRGWSTSHPRLTAM